MASFLSALNQRDDGYGGSRANRVRLPLEVYRAVRAAVSERFVVGCRFLAEECIPGGSTADDAAWFGAEFARAGMDYLSLSRGGKFEDAKQPRVGWARYPYTGPSGYECMPTVRSDERGPFGRNRAATRAVREAVRAAGCRHAGRPVGRHLDLRAGGGAAPGRRRGHHRVGPAEPGGPRLVPEAQAGPGATRCGAVSSPTTARASTRCTSR